MTKLLPLVAFLVVTGAAGAAGQGGSSGPSFARARAYPTGHGAAATAVGDLNGDRRPDLVSANAMRRTISVLINRGNGRFRTKREFGTGRNPKSVAIGDLDGDGNGDIAALNDAGIVSVLLSNGDGSFRGKRDYVAGRGSQSIALGDVNGDRRLDAVVPKWLAVSVFINAPGLCNVPDVTYVQLAVAKRRLGRAALPRGNDPVEQGNAPRRRECPEA
jgi:FG-GAP-like repeat